MKRHIKLIIMLGVLAILISGALLQKRFFPQNVTPDYTEDGASSLRYAVNSISEDNITAISYTYEGETLSFILRGNLWSLDSQSSPNINSELVAAMATAISSPQGKSKMENVPAEKLPQYGLDDPHIRVTVYEGDKTSSFVFGSYNQIAAEYYFASESDMTTVFTVESTARDAFDVKIDDLLIYDTLPKISAESITAISLSDSAKELIFSSVKTPSDENDAGFVYSALRTENGIKTEYSYADFYRLAEAVSEWNIDEFVSYDTSDSEKYGFGSPETLKIDYTEKEQIEAEGTSGGYITKDKSFELILGSTDENGFYYCKTSMDSCMIYKLSSSLFSELLS
ncbi:MAG: DUF4340 domain-containing protein [Clostridia bacterium]|nr:DUF4340 domain-containing protein [Clostridia bacterium]